MPEPDIPATNAVEITVSELSSAIRRAVEDRFGYVRVRGKSPATAARIPRVTRTSA